MRVLPKLLPAGLPCPFSFLSRLRVERDEEASPTRRPPRRSSLPPQPAESVPVSAVCPALPSSATNRSPRRAPSASSLDGRREPERGEVVEGGRYEYDAEQLPFVTHNSLGAFHRELHNITSLEFKNIYGLILVFHGRF
ncbi:hypothetical protein GUJ93_ZPchr0002g25873 [Zizania palustris]|uniref:Uncharacterized protein n=1 Tax=Zizania palustris TaxID=103762 RepID=A0A8J5VG42_ZIZPA|nr:hypothetical protein GUJ93_ZPchr0002g25873 [Zizania palustris]